MARPLYPNDFLRSYVFQPDGGTTTVLATRDRAANGAGVTFIISPDTFGSLTLDGNTLYEISFGPFFLANGDTADNSRDGAQARILFYIDEEGVDEALPGYSEYILRKPDPYRYPVDKATTYYFSDVEKTVKFGVALQHQGGKTFSGGDNCRSLPAPSTIQTNGATVSGTTEAKDSTLPDYQFTAIAGRTYRVKLTNYWGHGALAGGQTRIRIRDGGASAPTSSSTVVGESFYIANVAGTTGRNQIQLEEDFSPSAGTHTLNVFIHNAAAGDGFIPLAPAGMLAGYNVPRELSVEDVTPSGVDITDGVIQVEIDGDASGRPPNAGLRVRPIGRGEEMIVD